MADLSIAAIRAKYPDYKDLSDQQLSDALHAKFYGDMPKADFEAKVGLKGAGYSKAYADAKSAQASAPAKGYGGGVLNAAAQGGALGFLDEIGGGLAALKTGAQNLAAHTGLVPSAGYSASDAYHATVDADRVKLDDFATKHPVSNFVAGAAGGFLTPGIGAAGRFVEGAGSLVGAVGRSAAVGAGYGAAAGAGNATGGIIDRAKGAGVGAATGAALGAAVPGAVKLAQAVVTRGSSAAAEAGSSLVQATGHQPVAPDFTPEQQAAAKTRAVSYVNDIIAQSGKTADDLAAHPIEAAGKPITAAEAIGRSATYQLGALGRRAGGTADALEGNLTGRLIDRPNRLLNDVQTHLGVDPEAAQGGIDALVERGQAEAKPLYDTVRDTPGPILTDDLRDLARRPAIKKAARAAYEAMLNDGKDPEALGIVRNTHASASGPAMIDQGASGLLDSGAPRLPSSNDRALGSTVEAAPLHSQAETIPLDEEYSLKAPTAETWDYIKKALSGQVERNPFTNKVIPDSAHFGNRSVNSASRSLTSALRQAIPGYGEALDRSGDYLSVSGAYDRMSGALFGTKISAPRFSQTWNAMSDGERRAGQAAMANDILKLQQSGRLKPGVLQTPGVKAKLETAFGEQKAADFINAVEQERTLDKGYRMIPGTNSVTGETVLGDADAGHGSEMAHAVTSVISGQRSLHHEVMYRAARLILAPARGARTPINQATRDEVGRLLQLKPSELAAELRRSQAAAPRRVVGRRIGATAAVAGEQGGLIAKPDDGGVTIDYAGDYAHDPYRSTVP